MKTIKLSWDFEKIIPIYGFNKADTRVKQLKSIKKSGSSNTFSFYLENHWGTHIDAPAHFYNNGKKITDFNPEYFIFHKPFVLNLNKKSGQAIQAGDLNKITGNPDLLLIKTGFSKFRGKKEYSCNNPYLLPEISSWLKKFKKSVRAIGIDTVSISNMNHREIGRQTHRNLLEPKNPILIIEDMDLSRDLSKLKSVWVAPLFFKQLDSAACTIFGFLK